MLTHRILVELEGSDEPAWTYLEYQHAHILGSMKAIYSRAQEKCRGEHRLVSVAASDVSRTEGVLRYGFVGFVVDVRSGYPTQTVTKPRISGRHPKA